MASTDNKVELGNAALEKENGTSVVSLHESVPPGVPEKDVVTPKTWFAVFVRLPVILP